MSSSPSPLDRAALVAGALGAADGSASGGVVVLVGNPRADSRTLHVAQQVAAVVSDAVGAPLATVVDLATLGPEVLDHNSRQSLAARTAITASRAVVVASPTYKAAPTGLLKLFLDQFAAKSLSDVLAVPMMTGGSWRHALACEVHLRPVLVELGAMMPTQGLYFDDAATNEPASVLEEWALIAGPQLRRYDLRLRSGLDR